MDEFLALISPCTEEEEIRVSARESRSKGSSGRLPSGYLLEKPAFELDVAENHQV